MSLVVAVLCFPRAYYTSLSSDGDRMHASNTTTRRDFYCDRRCTRHTA